MLDDVLSHLRHNLLVFLHQVIPGHSWFTWETRGNYDNIRVCGIDVIIRACDQRVIAKHRSRLEHIQCLSLRHIGNNVVHYHVGVVAFCQALH